MRNDLWGLDVVNERLWFMRKIKDSTSWESTGLDNAGLILHVDFKAGLNWNLATYSKTDTIHAVLNDQFRLSVPRNAEAITIVDAIAKELGYAE